MKAIQVNFDEPLLEQIDADPEAKKEGRSAFLRHAAQRYLAEKRQREVDEAIARGYAEHPVSEDEHLVVSGGLTWPEE